MDHFTPISGFLGGCLIGIASLLLLYYNRQICGISGIFSGILPPMESNASWKVFFILGLFFGSVILFNFYPLSFEYTIGQPLALVFIGGLLVGFGSRLGKGCTSGHGVCGIGRMAGRSLAATLLFFITGVITATTVFLLKG